MATRKVKSRFENALPRSFSAAPLYETRQMDPTPTKRQRLLLRAWENFVAKKYECTPDYHEAEKSIAGLAYSAKDVERFSLTMPELKGKNCLAWHAGLFLSALINHGTGAGYVIHTRHRKRAPDALGFFNTKNIRVEGPVGLWLGEFMKRGIIVVNGNAGDCVGEGMKNGHIIVWGRAGKEIAQYMEAGTIIVKDGLDDPGSLMGGYSDKEARVFIEGGECPIKHRLGHLELYHEGTRVPEPG